MSFFRAENMDNRKLRSKHIERKDSELLSTVRHLDKLYEKKFSLRNLDSPAPIRDGWKKHFVLRKDIQRSRSKFGRHMRGVLKYIDNSVVSRNKEDLIYDRPRKSANWRIRYKGKLEPKILDKKEFERLPEHYKEYFVPYYRYTKYMNRPIVRYYFTHTWVLEYKIEPNYTYRYSIHDGELESEIDKINNRLYRDNLWPRWHKLKGYECYWKDEEYTARRKRIQERIYDEEVAEYFFPQQGYKDIDQEYIPVPSEFEDIVVKEIDDSPAKLCIMAPILGGIYGL